LTTIKITGEPTIADEKKMYLEKLRRKSDRIQHQLGLICQDIADI